MLPVIIIDNCICHESQSDKQRQRHWHVIIFKHIQLIHYNVVQKRNFESRIVSITG